MLSIMWHGWMHMHAPSVRTVDYAMLARLVLPSDKDNAVIHLSPLRLQTIEVSNTPYSQTLLVSTPGALKIATHYQ